MTFHAWRKTTATVLDEAGATARMIADQLGHSRVSMTQDVYLGRRSRESRVAAHWRASIRWRRAKVWGNLWGRRRTRRREASFPGQRAGEGTRTPNLLFTRQLRYRLRHASKTAISPGRRPSRHEDEARIRRHLLMWVHCVCNQVRGTVYGLPSDGPIRWRYMSAVIAMLACRTLRTTAKSAPEVSISDAARCLRPWKVKRGSTSSGLLRSRWRRDLRERPAPRTTRRIGSDQQTA